MDDVHISGSLGDLLLLALFSGMSEKGADVIQQFFHRRFALIVSGNLSIQVSQSRSMRFSLGKYGRRECSCTFPGFASTARWVI